MDRISAQYDDSHLQVQKLLPWFLTGQLSEAERNRVTDHIATCDACRSELAPERELYARVEGTAIDMDLAWAQMRRRIESDGDRRGRWRGARRIMLSIVDRPRAAAIVITAQAALLVAALALPPMLDRPAAYHALSAPSAPARPGNLIVMFAADLRAADIAALLNENGARIVDGPTTAGAYVLAVPAARRAAIVASLRTRPALTMAEPLDP